jgi:hypothetical protein
VFPPGARKAARISLGIAQKKLRGAGEVWTMRCAVNWSGPANSFDDDLTIRGGEKIPRVSKSQCTPSEPTAEALPKSAEVVITTMVAVAVLMTAA